MAEIVIAGAGPAGMAAAVSACSSGAKVTLIDDNPSAGGQIWRGGHGGTGWFARLRKSGTRIIAGARIVSGDAAARRLLVETENDARVIPYDKLIVATGARELFLAFPGWTESTVLGVGGLQALVKSGLSVQRKRIVVAGTGPFLLAAAAYLRRQGAIVPLIAEQTSRARLSHLVVRLLRTSPGKLLQALRLRLQLRGTRYLTSSFVESARDGLATVRQGSRIWNVRFDLLATGYGFRPNTELGAALGCALQENAIQVDDWQRTSSPDILAAGECTGIGGVDLALVEGQIAGLVASEQMAAAMKLRVRRRKWLAFSRELADAFSLRPELKGLPEKETVICRCEDVTWRAVKESRSRREAKLYTRCGMGPCQGRVCGPILDFLLSADCDTVRPPVFPARLETFTMTPGSRAQ